MIWKCIWANPRYEISSEGQVRVKPGSYRDKPGFNLKRHWADNKRRTPEFDENGKPSKPHGSLCVTLYGDTSEGGYRGNRIKQHRIWRLMERHHPGVPYPDEWKAGGVGGRSKLTPELRWAITYSPLRPAELVQYVPVTKQWISRLQKRATNV